MKHFISLCFSSIDSLGSVANVRPAAELQKGEMTPEFLYKVVSLEAWEESAGQEYLKLSADDNAFIHFATELQLPKILMRWEGKEYRVLKVSTSDLLGRLEYEPNQGRVEPYYHLYEGMIPMAAVEVDPTL